MSSLDEASDRTSSFRNDALGLLWPSPRRDGEYRFRDKRPLQRSSMDSSLPSTNSPPWLPHRPKEWKPPLIPRGPGRRCRQLVLTVALVVLLFRYCNVFSVFRYHKSDNYLLPADPRQRPNEFKNTLAGYKHFGKTCPVSSLDLHLPFEPVVIVGDSMLRHVIGALNIIIREDLGYGGVTDWNFNDNERKACFCNDQFDVKDCSVQGIFKTKDVLDNDPKSLACPRLIPGWSTDLRMEQMVRWPIASVELQRLENAVDGNPQARKAFVLGQGLWNDLRVEEATEWVRAVLTSIESKMEPGFGKQRKDKDSPVTSIPILLITPNAAGELKPDKFIVTQGNEALVRFEHAMGEVASRHGIDHLGTWNMSIQARLYDGVHMDMRGNLVKAMMVLNWLDKLDSRLFV
ncbi:hypothetical protein F5Y17DRAFT_474859 [Xylariaceae sp. FL0594]|nr:hypothetical protein F5Y17DRAFT_474859 [Xylariaceae sp. FL0594]